MNRDLLDQPITHRAARAPRPEGRFALARHERLEQRQRRRIRRATSSKDKGEQG